MWAEIKLRNINREYILKRVEETEELEREIADLSDILKNRRRIRTIITDELKQVIKKYGAPRRTGLVYPDEVEEYSEQEQTEDYPVLLFLSRGGYFKKITPLSFRMGGEHKYKEDDGPFQSLDATNRSELLVFTDRQQVYKTRVADFEDMKASQLGVFLPAHLGMDEGESVSAILLPGDYSGQVLLFFEDGKAARLPLSAYATKSNRKRALRRLLGQEPPALGAAAGEGFRGRGLLRRRARVAVCHGPAAAEDQPDDPGRRRSEREGTPAAAKSPAGLGGRRSKTPPATVCVRFRRPARCSGRRTGERNSCASAQKSEGDVVR